MQEVERMIAKYKQKISNANHKRKALKHPLADIYSLDIPILSTDKIQIFNYSLGQYAEMLGRYKDAAYHPLTIDEAVKEAPYKHSVNEKLQLQ